MLGWLCDASVQVLLQLVSGYVTPGTWHGARAAPRREVQLVCEEVKALMDMSAAAGPKLL